MLHAPKVRETPGTMSSADQHIEFLKSLAREAPNYQIELDSVSKQSLGDYFSLVMRWNPRLHLVAPCSAEEFATRHVLESLMLINHLPMSAVIADVGSGAGLPLLPCLIARPDLNGLLIESSKKKAVFLAEVLKQTGTQATVINKRFQEIEPPAVQFISCRAIEKFSEVLPELLKWTPTSCTLLLFGGEGLRARFEELELEFSSYLIPNSQSRFLYVVNAAASQSQVMRPSR